MSDNANTNRFDVHQAVTANIIEAIEAGAGTFTMPWHGDGASVAKPENAYTCVEYHGINVLALWAEACLRGFQSGHWASYKQWQQAGAQVRAGERGTTVVFFKRLDGDGETSDTNDEPRGRRPLVARASRVFNADQVSGWQPPMERTEQDRVELLASVDAFVAATGAHISHGAIQAFYNVPEDRIELLDRGRFIGTKTSTPTHGYYATLLHELIHWTGAPHRLDRKFLLMTKEELAAEELIAEIGAAFLCADLGVSNVPRPDHAAYVANWLQLLRNDTRAVFKASRHASAAANHLHEMVAGNL